MIQMLQSETALCLTWMKTVRVTRQEVLGELSCRALMMLMDLKREMRSYTPRSMPWIM